MGMKERMKQRRINRFKKLEGKAEEIKKELKLKDINTAILLLMYRELRDIPKSNS